MRTSPHRVVLALAVVLVAVGACSSSGSTGSGSGRGAQPDGFAEQVQAETDQVAERLLPALVTSLGVQVTPGLAGFVECDLTGWRYEGDVDLFLAAGTDQSAVPGQVTAVLEQLGLEIEERDDADTVLGRQGGVSVLLGQAAGPAQRPFRHLTVSQGCSRYSDADVAVAEATERRDWAAYVPPASVYSPG